MKADRYLFDGSHPCALRRLPCDSKDDHVKKEDILAKTAENLEKMTALQDAFYADGREGLVIILQALDAAGKDSTVKHVMGGLNPQGVQVTSFKQPPARNCTTTFVAGEQSSAAPRQHCHFQPQLLRGRSGGRSTTCKRPTRWPRACWKTARRTFLKSATARSAAMKNTCTRTVTAWSKSFCTFPRTNRKSAFRAH